MSEVMLHGVLRMPYELAMSTELSRRQFYGRAQEAAAELDRLQARVAELEVDAERLNSGAILLGDRDDFGEPYTRLIIGLDLRAAIDAARKAKP